MTGSGRKGILLFLVYCLVLPSYSQILPYEKYTSKNGLISDRITAISQDEKGFMWFGSYFGICRYDGIKFEKIALPQAQQNKFVTFLLPANNKMYAGFLFNSGLFEYSNGKVKSYFLTGKDSLFANEFVCGARLNDSSILLCNTSNQVYQFKNGVFSLLYPFQTKAPSFLKAIETDRYKNIFIATDRGLVVLPYPYTSEVWHFLNENIFVLLKDQSGKIWFSRGKGATTITETTDGWIHGTLQNKTTIAASLNLLPVPFSGNTAAGLYAINTGSELINLANKKTRSYKTVVDQATDVNAIFADRENNIWIANQPGVTKISNLNIQAFLFDELAADGGALYIENDSLIWVSNSKNLYTITNDTIRKKQLVKSSGYYGNIYIDSKKGLWIGLWNGGLWHIKRHNGKIISKEIFSEFNKQKIKAQVIIEDAAGNIWIGGANGIFRLAGDQIVERFQPPNAAGYPVFITCMAIDKKNNIMWLGDNALGIVKLKYKLQPGGKTSYTIEGYITQKDGLKDNYIRSLLLDHKNDLWIGTRSGGIYRATASGSKFTVINYNSAANISCARITDIKEEDTAAVWFASCDGIYRYRYATGKWDRYSTSKGLLNAEVFAIAVDAKKNILWAQTSQGVTKLQVNTIEKIPPPLINITGINVLGKPDSAALFNSDNTYSYTKNSIGFTFAGASFIDEKKIKYKYMLQGYDKIWSEPVMTNTVNYASLPPGKYVFKVIAANVKEQWSTNPATFEFEITMPVYKRPWFIFALILAGILAAYVIRVQQMKHRFKIEKLRLDIARDLHDDVGSTLGSINLLSKTATRKLGNNLSVEEVSPIFKKIGDSAENTLEAMDDIVWSINPQKDKVQDVIIRMREFAIPLLEAKNIQFSFTTEGNTGIPIPMDLRRNAFLVFKESIHNIIKHSEAGKVEIDLQVDNHFTMKITDHGKGFDVNSAKHRNGLKNMSSRAAMVRGTIQINSSHGGTCILFNAPIR